MGSSVRIQDDSAKRSVTVIDKKHMFHSYEHFSGQEDNIEERGSVRFEKAVHSKMVSCNLLPARRAADADKMRLPCAAAGVRVSTTLEKVVCQTKNSAGKEVSIPHSSLKFSQIYLPIE